MPHLKKFMLAPFAFAALVMAGFCAVPAWGQNAAQQDEQREIDIESDRRADDAELNGLRGVLGPGQNNPEQGDDQETLGRGELRDTLAPETEANDTGRSGRRTSETSGRDAARRVPRPANPDEAVDTARDGGVEEDPYAPLGIRLGSFLLFPELTSQTVYNDNVFLSSTSPQSDWSLELIPSLRVQSDWSRHSLTGTLSGIRSTHDKFTTENEETFEAGIGGQLDILSTTNLVAEANYREALEDRSSSDFPANAAERAKTRTRAASLEGNHTFNRVTLTTRGNILEEDFDDSTTDTGAIVNNDDRDYTEYRITGRAAYEFQPGVSAFFEVSGNDREFSQALDDDGTVNGSWGYDLQGGLSFKLTGKLTGDVSAGYAIQKADDTSLEDVDGLIFNAGLEWVASGLTTLSLDANSEVAETTQAGSAGSIVRGVEVSVEHRPRQHVLFGASVGYEVETFAGSDQEEQEWVFGLTGEYNFSRSVALMIGYQHLESFSSDPGSDYAVDEVRMGLRLRR